MSLAGLNNSTDPVIFGKDLSVLQGDVFISGDLTTTTINGTHAQNLPADNVWTNTNEWLNYRPTTSVYSASLNAGINKQSVNTQIQDLNRLKQSVTWTGNQTFQKTVSLSSTANQLPANANEAVTTTYLAYKNGNDNTALLQGNDTWVGSVIQYKNPYCLEPVVDLDIATKEYTDNTLNDGAIRGSQSVLYSASSVVSSSGSFGKMFQLVGGGSGSTSGNTGNSGGISGGSGALASIFILTGTNLTSPVPSGHTNFGTYTGKPGKGSQGTGTWYAGVPPDYTIEPGGATTLKITPIAGQGLSTNEITLLSASGGQGSYLPAYADGSIAGGVYASINPLVVEPYCWSNGYTGQKQAGQTYQYNGNDTYGAGGIGSQFAFTNGINGSVIETDYLLIPGP